MATKTPAKPKVASKTANPKKPASTAKTAPPKTAAAKKPAAKTATKPTAKTAPKGPAKPAPKVPAPAPAQSPISGVAGVTASQKDASSDGPFGEVDLTKKELIQRVVAATGMKPRDVRPVIEATLSELGYAVDRGETLRLNPFGVMQIKRAKQTPTGRVVVTKIKRKKQIAVVKDPVKDPLAKVAE